MFAFYVYWECRFGFGYRETVTAEDCIHAAIIVANGGPNRRPFGVDKITYFPTPASHMQ